LIDPILLVAFAVLENPGLTGRELSKIITHDSQDISKTEVNQLLYCHQNIFWRTVDQKLKPSWYLHENAKIKSLILCKNDFG